MTNNRTEPVTTILSAVLALVDGFELDLGGKELVGSVWGFSWGEGLSALNNWLILQPMRVLLLYWSFSVVKQT